MKKNRISGPKHPFVIDLLATTLRKPTARPLVEPAEAVAIALSMLPAKSTGQLCTPDCPAVRHVLLALQMAGWKLEPR